MKHLVALAFVCACGAPGPGAGQTISLRMTGGPADSRVTIDDQIVGSLDMVQARGVALPPGRHRISVEREGYFPFDVIVEAKEGEKVVRVDAKLQPVPD
ncbi:MAG TPA: PEGA domain-containing protein [Polyangiaceae bacterium]